MGVLEGTESVNLRVTFVGRTIVALNLEEKILHFSGRTTIHGDSEFFNNVHDLWPAAAKQLRNELHIPLRGERWAFRGNGGFEVADTLVKLLEPGRFCALRIAQCVHLEAIQLL